VKPRSPYLLNREQTVLVALDLQEPFLRKIFNRHELVQKCQFLILSAQTLDIPILWTTQYCEKMGAILPAFATDLEIGTPQSIDKLTFSAAANHTFTEALHGLNREQVLLCGVETHICVAQTAFDLQHLDYQVHVAADAVSSRRIEDHDLGIEKMRDRGILSNSAEGAVMELLLEAGTAEFKSILNLIK